MTPETAAALEASIEAWKKKARQRKPMLVNMGQDACPLCAMFFGNGCVGCPVSERVHNKACRGTPYRDVALTLWGWRDGCLPRSAFVNAARAEIAFLESLREVTE